MTPAELIAELRAALDADAATALDATFEETHPTGNHWQWGEIGNVPAPAVRDGYLRGNGGLSPTVSLVTVETYSEDGFDLPAEVLHGASRVYEGVARHIARHDPARVLADIAAKRALIDQYEAAAEDADDHEHGQHAASLLSAIETLAAAYGITT